MTRKAKERNKEIEGMTGGLIGRLVDRFLVYSIFCNLVLFNTTTMPTGMPSNTLTHPLSTLATPQLQY